jgi:transcription elongation factor SPT5
VAEAAFFTIFFLPYKCHLQHPTIHPKLQSRDERAKLFRPCNDTVEDPEKYLSQWSYGAEAGHIKRENVEEFIVWAFLNAGQAQTNDEDEGEVERYVGVMEQLLGRDIPSGKGSAKSLRLTACIVVFCGTLLVTHRSFGSSIC